MPTLIKTQTASQPHKVSHHPYGWLLVIINVIITAVFWWQLPPQIPLFYSLAGGTTQLAAKEWFFVLPGGTILVWMSYFLLIKMRVTQGIFSEVLRWLHVLCLFLFTLAIIHIIWIML